MTINSAVNVDDACSNEFNQATQVLKCRSESLIWSHTVTQTLLCSIMYMISATLEYWQIWLLASVSLASAITVYVAVDVNGINAVTGYLFCLPLAFGRAICTWAGRGAGPDF